MIQRCMIHQCSSPLLASLIRLKHYKKGQGCPWGMDLKYIWGTLLRLICRSFLQQKCLKSVWFLSCLGHKSRSNGTNYNGNNYDNNKTRTMQQKDKQFLFSKWVHFNRSLFKLLGNERKWLLVCLKSVIVFSVTLLSYFFNNAVSSIRGEELFSEKKIKFCYLIQAFTLVRSSHKFLSPFSWRTSYGFKVQSIFPHVPGVSQM